MLKFFNTEVNTYIEKYKYIVVDKISDPDISSVDESSLHTKYIHECSRGNLAARNYVIEKIVEILANNLDTSEKSEIERAINKEIKVFENGDYEKVDIYKTRKDGDNTISYYQLLEIALTDEQKRYLDEIKSGYINPIEVLATEIYKREYGLDKLDDLCNMKINNIEVHDINKIRVELFNGVWFTLKDYRISSNATIKTIAGRMLNQGSGADLTEEDCERESMLLDGSRITVALKPASSLDTIFIKKFDNFVVTVDEMLANRTLTPQILEDLKILAKGRVNACFIGGVNTGKTTLTKLYLGLFPPSYKIGVVDSSKDTNYLAMYPDRDIITLYETEQYDANYQFSRLLRMNRHILAISEARGAEVELMIKSMLRGNAGSFTTLHSSSIKSVVDNVAWMCLENGMQQDMRALRSRIANAIDIVIRVRHFENGERRIDEIAEIVATDNFDSPFKINYMYRYNDETDEVEKQKDFKLSCELENSLRYYGCTKEEIARLNS